MLNRIAKSIKPVFRSHLNWVRTVILVMAFAVAFQWVPSNRIPLGADSAPIPNSLVFLTHLASSWNWWSNLGSSTPPIAGGMVPLYVLSTAILSLLGLSYAASVQVYFGIFLFAGANSVSYLSRRLYLRRDPWPLGLLAPLLYFGNSYWLSQAGTIVVGVVLATGTLAFTLAAVLWACQTKSDFAIMAPAIGMTVLMTNIPFSVPLLFFLVAVLISYSVFLWRLEPRSHSETARRLVRIVGISVTLAVCGVVYLGVATILAWPSFAAHTTEVSAFFPLSSYTEIASRPLFVLLQLKNWALFVPELAPGWMKFYLASPVGIVGVFTLPVIAWGSLLVPSPTESVRRDRLFVAAMLLIALLLQSGTSFPGGYALWGAIVRLPEGANLFASVTSFYLSPFVMIGYTFLGVTTLEWLVESLRNTRAARGRREDGAPANPLRHRGLRHSTFLTCLLLAVSLGLGAGAVPVLNGSIGQWRAGAYGGTGVEVPSYYQSANQWLAVHNKNMSNTLVAPLAGTWPTLSWGNESGYQGINPYFGLLDSSPVIDGSAGVLFAQASQNASALINAAHNSIENPAALTSMRLPTDYTIHFLNESANLATNLSNWLPCTGCGTLQLDSNVTFRSYEASLRYDGNNSVTYGDPSGSNFRYRMPSPWDLSRTPLLNLWLTSSGFDFTQVMVGIGFSGDMASWTRPHVVSRSAQWSQFLIDLRTLPPNSIWNASSIIISYPAPSPSGWSTIWLGLVSLARGIDLSNGPNIAASAFGWTSLPDYQNNITWNPSVGLTGSSGSVEFEASNSASYADPGGNGLRFNFESGTNLSGEKTLAIWFSTKGTPTSSVYFGVGYGNGFAYWFRPTALMTSANWNLVSIALDASLYPGISDADSILVYYHPPEPSGRARIFLGHVTILPPSPPDPDSVRSLLQLLNVQYVAVDNAIVSERKTKYSASALGSLGFLKVVFSEGALVVYENLDYVGPVVFSTDLHPINTMSDLLADVLVETTRGIGVFYPSSERLPIQEMANASTEGIPSRIDVLGGTIELEATGPGLLVFPQAFSSGWVATADGAVLVHLVANGYANGWWVPAGSHEVRISYTPQAAYLSALVVGTTVTATLVGLLFWVTAMKPLLRHRNWRIFPRKDH